SVQNRHAELATASSRIEATAAEHQFFIDPFDVKFAACRALVTGISHQRFVLQEEGCPLSNDGDRWIVSTRINYWNYQDAALVLSRRIRAGRGDRGAIVILRKCDSLPNIAVRRISRWLQRIAIPIRINIETSIDAISDLPRTIILICAGR